MTTRAVFCVGAAVEVVLSSTTSWLTNKYDAGLSWRVAGAVATLIAAILAGWLAKRSTGPAGNGHDNQNGSKPPSTLVWALGAFISAVLIALPFGTYAWPERAKFKTVSPPPAATQPSTATTPDSASATMPPNGQRLGGIDIQGYCRNLHHQSGRLGNDNQTVTCYSQIGDEASGVEDGFAISLKSACAYTYTQYSATRITFAYDDPSNLLSGVCFAEPGHHPLGGITDMSAYCRQQRHDDHADATNTISINGTAVWTCRTKRDTTSACKFNYPNSIDVQAVYDGDMVQCYGRRAA